MFAVAVDARAGNIIQYAVLIQGKKEQKEGEHRMNIASTTLTTAAALAVGIVVGYTIPRSADETAENASAALEPASRTIKAAEREARADDPVAADDHSVEEKGPGREGETIKGDTDEEGDGVNTIVKQTNVVSDPEDVKKFSEAISKVLKNLPKENDKDKNVEFLKDLDTDWMTDEELAIHTGLLDLINRKAELDAEMLQNALSGDSRKSGIGSIAERLNLESELDGAYRKERDLLLRKTASIIGYSGEDSDNFVSTINDICNATTPQKKNTIRTVSIGGDKAKALGISSPGGGGDAAGKADITSIGVMSVGTSVIVAP